MMIFFRDKRGRLALTPTGASKFGQETDKNILIDEEGFSKYDFSDLSGYSTRIIGWYRWCYHWSIGYTNTYFGCCYWSWLGAGGGQAIEELLKH